MAALVSTAAYADNLIHNTSFAQPLSKAVPNADGVVNTQDSWIVFFNNGGSGDIQVKGDSIVGVSTNLNAPPYGAQVIQAPVKLIAGGKYKFSFDAASTAGPSELTFKLGADAGRQYFGYFTKNITVDGATKHYTYEFDMKAETDPKARLEFWFAKSKTPIALSNVSLEKVGQLPAKDLFDIRKFGHADTFDTLVPNENALAQQFRADLVAGGKAQAFLTLTEDGRYKFTINASADKTSKLEVGLRDADGKVVAQKTVTIDKSATAKSIFLKFPAQTTKKAEFFVTNTSNSKLNVNNISFSKDIGKLVWDDEFSESGAVNPKKWNHNIGGDGWGNGELEYYTDSTKNSYVKDGHLYIQALRQDKGKNKYTSARLTTKGKGDWTYGRIEVRAKLPGGRGMWPAIWMLPTDNAYGPWPKSGEIDILEYVGFEPNKIHATIHDEKYSWLTSNQKTAEIPVNAANVQNNFNVYALEWTPNIMKVYKDNVLYFTFKNEGTGHKAWPFNKPFHLVLNAAVGGSWGGVKGVDNSVFPQKMVVDYVRVYNLGMKK